MVASMTAFSRQSSQNAWGELTWELRSVNQRFLDLNIRLPESLRGLEPAVRECLSKKLHRGKVEASLRFTPGSQLLQRLSLNSKITQQLAEVANEARRYFPDAQTDLMAILSWPGVLETTDQTQQELVNTCAVELLQQAVDDLINMRRKEGARIKAFIQERLTQILSIVNHISQQIPQFLAVERERMTAKITELNVELNTQRLEQEMTILIQKSDVAEEIQRLRSHCEAMEEALSQPAAVGRRLDFLSQELNREANTLSSKALAVSLTQASVEIKVLIEQIREQVQNIE
jgi:uncharacterized protein (TIGR00255 family)